MSIKNKFVTAITTAGLLAGLFGSAFVPSAFASTNINQDETYVYFDNSGDAEDGYVEDENAKGAGDNDNVTGAGVDTNGIRLASWSTYGTPGSKFCGIYEATYGECDQQDNSIGFYVEKATGGNSLENADMSATATGGKVKFAWAHSDNDGRTACWDNDLEWSTTSAAAYIDSTRSSDYGDGDYALCIQPVSKTTLGVSTLTVKADGVTIYTGKIQVLGDLKTLSLSITDGYNRVSANNSAVGNFWTVVGKDAAGQKINAIGDAFNTTLEDWVNGSVDQGSEPVLNANDNEVSFFNGVDDLQSGLTWLDDDVCEDDDAGSSLSAYVEVDSRAGTLVESNSVSIACTGDADTAVISGVSQEYSSPVLKGEADWAASAQGLADAKSGTGEIDVFVTIKDEDGALMGVDGSTGFGIDFSLSGNEDLGYAEDDNYAIGAGGKLKIAGYVPDMSVAAKFALTVTVVNPDSNSAIESNLVAKVYYQVSSIDSDYTLTRVRNGAKTSATWTADWGLDCSNAVVYFDWVNKNGTKGTLVTGTSPIARRADFDGVAKFTLKKRNMTIYVTAYACDDFTDMPDELGPVAARFR
jgi:hypothetical protein